MVRLFIQLCLLMLVFNLVLSPCEAFRGSRAYGGSSKSSKSYKESSGQKTLVGSSPGIPSQHATRRGLGISAWGIVALTVFLILAGMSLYYFVTCYPIICQKQTSYNIMAMTPV